MFLLTLSIATAHKPIHVQSIERYQQVSVDKSKDSDDWYFGLEGYLLVPCTFLLDWEALVRNGFK